MKNDKLRKLTFVSIAVALHVVLSRFLSINAWNIKIGFTFLTLFFIAYFYGPIWSATTGALGDLIGSTLFPIGPYYPGFTLTSALMGFVYGFFLKRNTRTKNILIAVLINQFILSLFLNSYWIHLLYHADYKALLLTRIFQSVILSLSEIITLKLMSKYMPYFERRIDHE